MATVNRREWNRNGKSGDSWQVSWMENGRQHKKSGFKTKKEADAWKASKEMQLLNGVSREQAHRLTIADVSVEYREDLSKRVAGGLITPNHEETLGGHLYNYIARPVSWQPPSKKTHGRPEFTRGFEGSLALRKLSELRPKHVEAFRDALSATGMSHNTTRAILRALHALLEFCRRRDYVAVNVASRIPVGVPRSERGRRVSIPTSGTLQKVLNGSPERLKLMLQFAATTGLRMGELRCIQWDAIDLDGKWVTVRRSVDSKNRVGPPKSAAGLRRVPISEALATRLRDHRASSAYPASDDMVFAGRNGGFVGASRMLMDMQAVTKRLGEPTFTWHALRHYAISAWIRSKLSLKAVQTFAGHSDIKVTVNTYGHLFEDDDYGHYIDGVGSDLIR